MVEHAPKILAVSRGGRNPGLGMPSPSEHEGATVGLRKSWTMRSPPSLAAGRLRGWRHVAHGLHGSFRARGEGVPSCHWAFAKYATVIGSKVNRAVSLEHSMRCVRESHVGQACRPLKTPL
jgi:hypothetical protein